MPLVAIWIVLIGAFPGIALADHQLATAFADRVAADLVSLKSQEALGNWKKTHNGDSVSVVPDRSIRPVDFEGLDGRCATSTEKRSSGPERIAMFLVPSVTAGHLPTLPGSPDSSLRLRCVLGEIWYETPEPIAVSELVDAFQSRWGGKSAPAGDLEIGHFVSWEWQAVAAWHRDGMRAWIFCRQWPPSPPAPAHPPVVGVWIRNDRPQQVDWIASFDRRQQAVHEQSKATLARLAAADPTLTGEILARTNCGTWVTTHEEPSISVDRLGRWLRGAAALPPERAAAVFLLADYYMVCAERQAYSEAVHPDYGPVGAIFDG